MTKTILTNIALSAVILPFFSNASEVTTVNPAVTPAAFTITVELPAPVIDTSVKVQAQQNLLTDQFNLENIDKALLVNLNEAQITLNSATRAE
ncbi:hypothetical protein [Alteromonas sp. AMM-1]|uniref:hypothetical protein n=1 Tax=Alteromonas sp. AMM-1 TaxID=3394233 RepID=UPI0039A5E321